MDRGTLSVALVLSLWIAGCGGGGDEPLCTPGASVACVGTGGCSGGQVCNAEGTGFGWKTLASISQRDSQLPTSCIMSRP